MQGLIETGVNLNRHILCDSTHLTWEITCDHFDIARAILAAPGTDINFPTRFGETPISCAAYKGADEIICARNHVSVIGRTALHIAASSLRTSTLKILLEDPKVDRNIVCRSGKTALDCAIENYRLHNVIQLLNDPLVVKDRIYGKGMTILHKIARRKDYYEIRRVNRLRILEAILGVGVIDVNHQDHRGKTALHYAVESGDPPEIILRLTAAGADSAIEDKSGQSAIDYARRK